MNQTPNRQTSHERTRTVLQVLPALTSGGAERTAVDIAHALVDAGWRAIIASAGGPLVGHLPDAASHVTLPLETKNPLTAWRNARRLGDVITREGVDIVHARSRAPAWSALIAARRAGVPFVTTYHGAYSQSNAAKAAYNSVMARGDAVIANSQWTANLVAQRHPKAADRIVPIPRGTDFSLFDPARFTPADRAAQRAEWGVGDDAFVAVQVARMGSWKGQEVVVDAVAQTAAMVAVLAGGFEEGGPFITRLRTRIADKGLVDRIVLPGFAAEPQRALHAADCVIVASTRPEAFGRAAVEAGAMERIVIVSDLGAVGETVVGYPDPCATGWKVPANDAPALANALKAVATLSAAERDAIARRARARSAELFSLERMCATTLDVYRRVTARTTS